MRRAIIMGISLFLVAMGMAIYQANQEEHIPEFGLKSLDQSKVQIEDEYIFVLRETTQEELLNLVENNGDFEVEINKYFTTSEKGEKQKAELFDYDRLYIESDEEELRERYYHIRIVESF